MCNSNTPSSEVDQGVCMQYTAAYHIKFSCQAVIKRMQSDLNTKGYQKITGLWYSSPGFKHFAFTLHNVQRMELGLTTNLKGTYNDGKNKQASAMLGLLVDGTGVWLSKKGRWMKDKPHAVLSDRGPVIPLLSATVQMAESLPAYLQEGKQELECTLSSQLPKDMIEYVTTLTATAKDWQRLQMWANANNLTAKHWSIAEAARKAHEAVFGSLAELSTTSDFHTDVSAQQEIVLP